MAGFKLIGQPIVEATFSAPISSLTVSKGDLLALGAGATTWSLGAATTEHWQLKAVALADAITADTEVLAILVSSVAQEWEAESANNSNAAHNGDRMLLTDEDTVNNTGTDSTAEEACFIQTGVIGAAADKRIKGIIVPGTGVNPDAA